VARSYLDWIAALPWSARSEARVDIGRAQEILDQDHYDLDKVKERILEHLAVYELKQDLKGPILCFVGPPGVGKTSLGRSIARAMGREFMRLSLGGMHDEAEIRGHRRTYVGALPGQIIQGLRRAGTKNPVFMLDEVDKVGRDFRGDPAAALLEVLDPEQNNTFRDHYLEVPFDLSEVLFITTANILDPIAGPLLDRMEVLELVGYIDEEKQQIAKRYLVPRQLERHGLQPDQLTFTDEGILTIMRGYTREAGVRKLEQQVASICRKRAKQVVQSDTAALEVTPQVVQGLLGVERFKAEAELEMRTRQPGVAVAVAWTPAGGEILFVEATRMPGGKGTFVITGQVREVMQESAKAAMSWVRSHAALYDIPLDAFRDVDVHMHIPHGAVPKDGPSAGSVMVAALLSLFTETPVEPRVAMTGEITLSGLVLPVGGIKEKVLAAKRNGVEQMVLPADNEPDVREDVPAHLCEGMTFHFVHTLEEALQHVLPGPSRPRPGASVEADGLGAEFL
jgi:ATP-dependent Lon protease